MASTITAEGDKRDLMLITNRLPLSLKRVNGTYQPSLPSENLFTSLSGLKKSTRFRCFGWPGIQVKDLRDREQVWNSLAEYNAVPIFLDNNMIGGGYTQFSNTILWPILHSQSGVVYDDLLWLYYKCVNEIFADRIAQEAKKGSLIWVHDYHLMLLPKLLRERLRKLKKPCAIGFSLHTPFPAGDIWKSLTIRNKLIEGMLASDMIAFDTNEDTQNFVDICGHVLVAQTEVPGIILYEDRLITVLKFVVENGSQKLVKALEKPDIQNRIEKVRIKHKDLTVIIGVDQLEYIEGLTQRLRGFNVG